MKTYGNICFIRRIFAFVGMFFMAVSVLMPSQIVKADSVANNNGNRYSGTIESTEYNSDGSAGSSEYYMYAVDSDSPVYTFAVKQSSNTVVVGLVSASVMNSVINCHYYKYSNTDFQKDSTHLYNENNGYLLHNSIYCFNTDSLYKRPLVNIYLNCEKHNDLADYYKWTKYLIEYVSGKNNGEKLDIDLDAGHYSPDSKHYKEIGSLKNVRVETVQDINSIVDVEGNSDLSNVKQDKVIVYDSTSSSGVDLSKGGYKVQLYGSFAYQSRDGDIIHEDKGTKTFIKDWNAENNIRKSGKYTYIDWSNANKIVDAGKSKDASKPTNAEMWINLNHMYQFEPIWYLRIVSKDNKYGPWVRVERTSGGKYKVDSVDDNDNPIRDDDGGYKKPDSNSEVVSGGDGLNDAKDKIPKAEEKQDEDDKDSITNANNSTFDKLEQFVKGIGDVPKIIADIFSFLPSWCLEVVAIGFALLMILIVVKFIRG